MVEREVQGITVVVEQEAQEEHLEQHVLLAGMEMLEQSGRQQDPAEAAEAAEAEVMGIMVVLVVPVEIMVPEAQEAAEEEKMEMVVPEAQEFRV